MNIRLFKPSLGEEELASIRDTFQRSWVGLGPKVAEFEKDLGIATGIRDEADSGIKPRMLDLYRRILQGRAPQALYPLRSGACGHCYTAVPLHRRQQIENGQAVEACEACGVLVYKGSE